MEIRSSPSRRRLDDALAEGPGAVPELRAQWERAQVKAQVLGLPAPPVRVGRFVVRARLGRGGMGEVFAARDEELEREVAVKVLAASTSELAGDRFAREARALARLSHPNIVQVYEVGVHEGRTFIAMELVHGATIGAWGRGAGQGSHRSWRELLRAYLEAGRGLAAAHAAGLVHRDFKPDNVMVGDDGRVRVLDFGLARTAMEVPAQETTLDGRGHEEAGVSATLGSGAGLHRVTTTGAVLGTPAYMAPEQHVGQAVSPATDQFSFCVSLFEALHGRRPFPGGTRYAILHAIRQGPGREPTDARLPRRLDDAIGRGLAADPTMRHPSMDALLGELERVLRRGRVRLVVGGALLGALPAVGLGFALAASTSGRPCEALAARADRELPEVWDEPRRAALRASFEASGAAYAREASRVVEQGLDEWVRGLGAARLDACEAHHVRAELSAERFDRRMACLERQQAQAEALAELLADTSISAADVATAPAAVSALPTPQSCAAAASDAAPATPEAFAVSDRLARATARLDLARYEEGQVEADAALALARETGQPAWVDRARLVGARLALARDHHAEGVTTLEQVAHEALGRGDDRLAAAAWLTLANHAQVLEDVDRGRGWWRLARAEYEREGETDPRGDAALRLVQIDAGLDRLAGDWAGAEAKQRELIEAHRARVSRAPSSSLARLGLAVVLQDLGSIRFDRGALEDAEALYVEALAIVREELGPLHPRTAVAELDLGLALRGLGRFEGARDHLERALLPWASARAKPASLVGTVELALSDLAGSSGELDDALDHARRARSIFDATLPPGHPDHAAADNTLAAHYYSAGRLEPSVEAYTRAIAGYEAAFGPEHFSVAIPASNLGESLVALGRFEASLPHFERAERILAGLDGNEADLAYPLKGRGLALVGLGRAAEARPVLERAFGLAAPSENYERAEIAMGLAVVAAARGDRARARELAGQAWTLAADELGYGRVSRLLDLLGGPDRERLGRGAVAAGEGESDDHERPR